MRHGIPAPCEVFRVKQFDAVVRDVDRVHQIFRVGDIAAEMNTQFQDGKGLGAGAVHNSSTDGVPTSVSETPAFALQEAFRILLLAQTIDVHGSREKAVFDAIQQCSYLSTTELG